ncbi:ADP-ribose pyrophosphatase YjhB (NUDIX family) [Haloactinospora alba]|uniref:ADP-ribose pyrophosphatase YjhB (NUDIX family) n=1 Tax=Haloactinospora alba TaxID=405555 RepID=A0A543NIZ4_9ACTN|nr:ADP-ribose pyrophosphatase YjhB (NUDIX family) [Haloactinospora alba]
MTEHGPRKARRVCAHVTAHTPEGSVLVDQHGRNQGLPGGRVRFGDDPAQVAHQAANLPPGAVLTPHDSYSEVVATADAAGPVLLHIDRIHYTCTLPAGTLLPTSRDPNLPALPQADELVTEEPQPNTPVLRRFGCYGVVTDTAGRVLLSRIAPGYPSAGSWHLPGGGVDHGEDIREALLREITEETGQHGNIGTLTSATYHRRPNATGPESSHTDLYAVWVFFRVHVSHPKPAVVSESNGSTADCAWFPPEELAHLRLSATARHGLAHPRGED